MLPKEKIRTLIGEAKIREALQLFLESIEKGDNVSENDIIQLQSRFTTLELNEIKGILSHDEAQRDKAIISNSILSLLDSWKRTDTASDLDKIIRALPIDKDADLGVIQLVNCDRVRPIKQFSQRFNDKKSAQNPFQFYFLSGCPDEMPSSLAERILYEIVEKESLVLDSSVHYPFTEGDFRRVKLENLPLSTADADASKKKFKEYVQKRFAFANTESFEKFIQTGIPKLSYSYVATIFKLSETDWEDDEGEILEYLQWMMDTFQTAHPNVPTFIFLFVLHFRNLHDETKVKRRNLDIVKKVETFCETNETAIFREIVPIKDMHLEDWLFKLGVENSNDSQKVIEALSKSLRPEDKLMEDGEARFHMKDVEPLQMKVVQTFRNR